MNEKNMLLRQIQSVKFAMWELHVFLDTHPNDKDALHMINEYKEKGDFLVKKYEEKYGPLKAVSENSNKWEWVSNPWPWENNCGCEEACINVEL